jgi:hypothetical protein
MRYTHLILIDIVHEELQKQVRTMFSLDRHSLRVWLTVKVSRHFHMQAGGAQRVPALFAKHKLFVLARFLSLPTSHHLLL